MKYPLVIMHNGVKIRRQLVLDKCAYYGDSMGEQVVLFDNNMKVMSDNWMAENELFGDGDKIVSGEIKPIWISTAMKAWVDNEKKNR